MDAATPAKELSDDEIAYLPPSRSRKRGVRRESGSDFEASQPKRRSTRAPKPVLRDLTPAESIDGTPTPTKPKAAAPRKAAARPAAKPKAPRRVKEDVFNEPEKLIGPQKSILYREETDLVGILRSQKAIEILSASEQGYPFLDVSDSKLKYYVELFKSEGRLGYHDPDWCSEALVAAEERAAGMYDEYLEAKFKEEWGDDENEYYTESEDGKDEEVEKKRKDSVMTAEEGQITKDEGGGPKSNSDAAASREEQYEKDESKIDEKTAPEVEKTAEQVDNVTAEAAEQRVI